jgi:uncharacterized GH25 family protein
MRILSLLVLLPLLAVSAFSHDLYLVSGTPGAEGKVCAAVGEHFPASMNAITAARIDRWQVIQGSEKHALKGAEAPGKQFCAKAPVEEPFISEMIVYPTFIKLAGKDFTEYTTGEGMKEIVKLRAGNPDAEGRELYSRYSKLLVGASPANTQPLGHVLEIVPLKDPATLKPGEALEVQVLFRGKPLADVQVAAAYSGAEMKGHEFPVVTRTDAEGKAVLKLDRGGLWYARLIHMVPAGHDPDYQWRSFFSTMTFTVGK